MVALNEAARLGEELDLDNIAVDEADCQFVILGPTGGVVAFFRVSLMLGAIIAIPMITYQLLMFIFPGLTRKERRVVVLSLPAMTWCCFWLG